MADPIQYQYTLYRRTLGADFDSLPAVLKTFHDRPRGGTAQGLLRITRGEGWLRRALAELMRLPTPGERVPVFLEVRVEGEAERWIRGFGTRRLLTKQWLEDGLLIETAGPFRMGFRLAADSEGMRFEFARCQLMRVALPAALAPRVTASASAYENGWWVTVQIAVPLLGMLTQYEGKMMPQC